VDPYRTTTRFTNNLAISHQTSQPFSKEHKLAVIGSGRPGCFSRTSRWRCRSSSARPTLPTWRRGRERWWGCEPPVWTTVRTCGASLMLLSRGCRMSPCDRCRHQILRFTLHKYEINIFYYFLMFCCFYTAFIYWPVMFFFGHCIIVRKLILIPVE
jgi:hypothetical protein